MAATRKLQAEIDRCLKKVAEGADKFEETWEKVHNASNTNQKEKYEEDLKKEIKKLQRLRDQIKTWIASGEVKDKSLLMEKRKLIELKMEKFKVVERETKTKAYSKEGLTSGTGLDPVEKERHETGQWLNKCIDELNIQIDQFEAEIETLAQSKKKKNRSENADKIEDYQILCEKHREHVQKLETLLRMLDNDQVNISQIKDIKDDVEYYIENCQEPDFTENEMMYDDIDGFEEMLLDLSNVGGHEPNTNSVEASETMSTNSASSPIPYMQHNHSNSDQLDNEKRRHKSSSDDSKVRDLLSKNDNASAMPPSTELLQGGSQPSAKVQPLAAAATAALVAQRTNGNNSVTVNSAAAAPTSSAVVSGMSSKPVAPVVAAAAAAAAAAPSSSSVVAPATPQSVVSGVATSNLKSMVPGFAATSSTPNNSSPSSGPTSTAGPLVNHVGGISSGSVVGGGGGGSGGVRRDFLAAVNGGLNGHGPRVRPSATAVASIGARNSSPSAPPLSSTAIASSASASITSSAQFSMPSSPAAAATGLTSSSVVNDSMLPSLKAMAKNAVAGLSMNDSLQTSSITQQPQQTSSPASVQLAGSSTTISESGLFPTAQAKDRSQKKTEAHIPPLLGVAPLGPVPLNKETQLQYAMLEAAYMHMPHPSDSERLRPYLPRNPCVTPAYYPQLPPQGSDSLEFFLRLSTETLFFIFYYMEGTKAQYLAAKALKKQSWRFHTKYMMWFQRHEEPKIINDEYEQGTYIYFDFEKWGQRRKEGFTFEYRFLEDRDLS